MGLFAWIDETDGAVAVVAALGLNLLVLLAATAAIATGAFVGQNTRWRTRVDLLAEERTDPSELMTQ